MNGARLGNYLLQKSLFQPQMIVSECKMANRLAKTALAAKRGNFFGDDFEFILGLVLSNTLYNNSFVGVHNNTN